MVSTFFESIGLSGDNAFCSLSTAEYFPTEQSTAAVGRLVPVLELGGIMVLVGDSGIGKSTVLDYVLRERVDKNLYRWVRVDFTRLSAGSFLRQLVFAFEEQPRRSKSDVVHQLVSLWNCLSQRVLLVVEEAHHLNGETLEDLRLLLVCIAHSRKLAVILAGQPPLREMLRSPLQQPLSGRITARYVLRGWTPAETHSWLTDRLARMGASPDFMEQAAVEMLYHYAKGNPRLLCQCMTHCLICMVTEGQKKLDIDYFKRCLMLMEG